MSYDNKLYPNRKDWMEPYRGPKAVDRSCRNHGSCRYCQLGRTHTNRKRELVAKEKIDEYKRSEVA